MIFNLALVLAWIIYKKIWNITNLFEKTDGSVSSVNKVNSITRVVLSLSS